MYIYSPYLGRRKGPRERAKKSEPWAGRWEFRCACAPVAVYCHVLLTRGSTTHIGDFSAGVYQENPRVARRAGSFLQDPYTWLCSIRILYRDCILRGWRNCGLQWSLLPPVHCAGILRRHSSEGGKARFDRLGRSEFAIKNQSQDWFIY